MKTKNMAYHKYLRRQGAWERFQASRAAGRLYPNTTMGKREEAALEERISRYSSVSGPARQQEWRID